MSHQFRRLATPIPSDYSPTMKPEKLTPAMELLEEEEEEDVETATATSSVVKDLLKNNEASSLATASKENKAAVVEESVSESKDVQPSEVVPPLVEVSDNSNPTTGAPSASSSRTTTGTAESLTSADAERPKDFSTACLKLALACARSVRERFPDSAQVVIDDFIEDPVDSVKTYSAMAVDSVKNVDLDTVKSVAHKTYSLASALIAKLPIKEVLQFLRDKTNELIQIAVPIARQGLKDAMKKATEYQVVCQQQLTQYCERRRSQKQEGQKQEGRQQNKQEEKKKKK